MRTLARVASTPTPLGDPLPTVFQPLAQAGIRPRRGTVTIIAGIPGSAKSFLALKWILGMGSPSMFFSADTDSQTTVERAGAMVTQDTQEAVRKAMKGSGASYYADELEEPTSHIRWTFETDPTYDDLLLETMAFAEVHGDFPAVICIDTLSKVVGQNEDEWGSLRDHEKALVRLAAKTNAAVFVVHHMSERTGDPRFPAPRKDILGQVTKTARLILSVAFDGEGKEMRVAAVKNAWAPDDKTGETYVSLYVDLDRGQFATSRQALMTGHYL